MSKTYFIGGAPRIGKTTVIQELIRRKPMLAASTDAIRSVAKGLSPPETNPRLHKIDRAAFGSDKHVADMKNNPEVALSHEIGEAEETWKSVLDFLSYYQSDSRDAAVEGVAVMPEQLSKLTYRFRTVFVVNLTDQTETILEHVSKNPNDWLRKYDKDTIRTYSSFNLSWNKYFAKEANKYGFPVVEVDTNNFQTSIESAVAILLKD